MATRSPGTGIRSTVRSQHSRCRRQRSTPCSPGRPAGRGPLADPRVRVSVPDAADGREHLPHVGCLAVAAAKRFFHAELKVVIFEEDGHFWASALVDAVSLTAVVRLAAQTTSTTGTTQLKIVLARRVSIAPAI